MRRPVNRDSKAYRLGYRLAPAIVGTIVGSLAGLTVLWIMWGGH